MYSPFAFCETIGSTQPDSWFANVSVWHAYTRMRTFQGKCSKVCVDIMPQGRQTDYILWVVYQSCYGEVFKAIISLLRVNVAVQTLMKTLFERSHYWVCDFTRCTAQQCKWQKNSIGIHCWISHSRAILNEIQVAVPYNALNRKITIVFAPIYNHGLSQHWLYCIQ